MKNFFTFLFITLVAAHLKGQNCRRDSSILTMPPNVIILPPFYDAVTQPDTTTPPACIGEFYNLSVTLRVPETFTYLGNTLPLDSVVLPPNAVTGLPNGLTYSCDPPSCSFRKNTLGCIRIFGTPTADNPIKAYTLGIKVKAFTPFLPGVGIDLSFPLTPTQAFFIRLRPKGQCTSNWYDLPASISAISTIPNPTTGTTFIRFDAVSADDFQFEVFDAAGQRVHTQHFRAVEGENMLTWHAESLSNGIYYFRLGNQKGSLYRKLIKI